MEACVLDLPQALVATKAPAHAPLAMLVHTASYQPMISTFLSRCQTKQRNFSHVREPLQRPTAPMLVVVRDARPIVSAVVLEVVHLPQQHRALTVLMLPLVKNACASAAQIEDVGTVPTPRQIYFQAQQLVDVMA